MMARLDEAGSDTVGLPIRALLSASVRSGRLQNGPRQFPAGDHRGDPHFSAHSSLRGRHHQERQEREQYYRRDSQVPPHDPANLSLWIRR